MKDKIKILFLLNKRSNYGPSFGLKCSCSFVSNALKKFGIESKIEEIIDGNGADKEIQSYSPNYVVFEAIFITPAKIKELLDLYRRQNRKITFFVRIHSNSPFLSREGIAMQWIKEYFLIAQNYSNFNIACNDRRIQQELLLALRIQSVYLPNIYCPPIYHFEKYKKYDEILDIASFGAIRELKAIFPQALSAIIFANENNKMLRFHINSNRIEEKNDAILKNLRNLFKDSNHCLVEHQWQDHRDFCNIIRKMDIVMQCSFSETYNIVMADAINNHVAAIGSKEIKFISFLSQAAPTSYVAMGKALDLAYFCPFLKKLNRFLLKLSNEHAEKAWLSIIC